MFGISRPVSYGAFAALVLGFGYWNSLEPDKPAKTKSLDKVKATASADSEFTSDDFSAHFDKPKQGARNIFVPLVKAESATLAALPGQPNPEDQMKIQSTLAGGEANWAYTGIAIVSGEKLALLENTSLKQSGFIKEGDTWKASKVMTITRDTITLKGKDGSVQTVMRYNPFLLPKAAASTDAPANPAGGNAGFQPVNPGAGMRGPIGQDIGIRPAPGGRGIQLPPGVTIIQ